MSRTGPRPSPRNLFSFSRLKTFHQCPARYRLRYLKGLNEVFRSIETRLGSAVHEALEWLYRERDEDRSPDVAAALECFDDAWRSGSGDEVVVVRVEDDPAAYHRAGRDMVASFCNGVFARDRSTTIALERRLSAALDGELRFTGIADRIGRTERGRLFVVDYKTSKQVGDPSDFSEGLQAPLYAACVLDREPDAEAVAGYHYLRHGSTSWHPVDHDRADALRQQFSVLAREAHAATVFPARPSVLCAWCGFNAVCAEAQVPEHLAGGLRRAREIATTVLPGDPQ